MAVSRTKVAMFLNTTPDSTATYELLGKGVAELSIEYNPQTQTEQDIISDTADTELTGYQPNAPVTQKIDATDAVYNFVDDLRVNRKVLSEAVTDVILVDLYKSPQTNAYPAEKQTVSIQIDNYGGAGGETPTIGFTINFKGDSTIGTFDPATKTFTAS